MYTAFSGWTGSDVWYALPDDGETTSPAFAVGRFPAQTAEQMAAMVQKTLSYEAQAGDLGWRSDALLVADNDEPGFAEETSAFADELDGYRSQAGDDRRRRRECPNALLADAFKAGTGLIGYFGHGSVTLWGKEKVFDVAEAAKLAQQGPPAHRLHRDVPQRILRAPGHGLAWRDSACATQTVGPWPRSCRAARRC